MREEVVGAASFWAASLSVLGITRHIIPARACNEAFSGAFCRYWVFRSWGRVGTVIGSNKLEEMNSKEEAIDHFLNLYQEKTGNAWHSTNFTKYPNKFYPLEIDYGQVGHCGDS